MHTKKPKHGAAGLFTAYLWGTAASQKWRRCGRGGCSPMMMHRGPYLWGYSARVGVRAPEQCPREAPRLSTDSRARPRHGASPPPRSKDTLVLDPPQVSGCRVVKPFVDHWRIAHATPGRAFMVPLPGSITDEQLEWLQQNLPRVYRLIPPGEGVGHGPRADDLDHQLDTLRDVTSQVTEKKLELLRTEQELSKAKLELERLKVILEERKKHAKSLGGALAELAEQLGFKLGPP